MVAFFFFVSVFLNGFVDSFVFGSQFSVLFLFWSVHAVHAEVLPEQRQGFFSFYVSF